MATRSVAAMNGEALRSYMVSPCNVAPPPPPSAVWCQRPSMHSTVWSFLGQRQLQCLQGIALSK